MRETTRIGPYRLIRRLGMGGMGEVLLAYDERLERPVAIRQVRRDAALDPVRRERLRRPAEPSSDRPGVRHPRAVRGRPLGIAPAARSLLLRYALPGNIRELSNAIERAVVLGQDNVIQPDDLPETLLETGRPAPGGPGVALSYHEALNRFKREIILEALAASGGTVTRAAEPLCLHPNHLHRLITSLDLRTELT